MKATPRIELLKGIMLEVAKDATGPVDIKVTSFVHKGLTRSFSVTRNGLKGAISYACQEREWWARSELYTPKERVKAYFRVMREFGPFMEHEGINPCGSREALRPWLLLDRETVSRLVPGSPPQVGLNSFVSAAGVLAFHTVSKQASWTRPLAPHFREGLRIARAARSQPTLTPAQEEKAYQEWVSRFAEYMTPLGFEI